MAESLNSPFLMLTRHENAVCQWGQRDDGNTAQSVDAHFLPPI
jgi:hypothetical protein